MQRSIARLLRPPQLPLAGLLILALSAPAHAAESRACAFLGDRLGGRADLDVMVFTAAPGEQVEVLLEARADARNQGSEARLRVRRGGRRRGALPLQITRELRRGGEHAIKVQVVRQGGDTFTGEYCVTLRSSGSAAYTLRRTSQVEVQWVAIEEGVAARPPFERKPSGVASGLIQPEFPLRGGSVYGLIVTNGARGIDGRALEASADFRAAKGTSEATAGGPVALYSSDPEAIDNPFPEARLVRDDGTIVLPERFVLRGLDPLDPVLDAARATLLDVADELSGLTGFGAAAAVEVALSAPLDLASLTPDNLLFFERTDGRRDLEGLLKHARREGKVKASEVALAISFPVQQIEEDLRDVRARLEDLAPQQHFTVTFDDDDPGDELPLGLFEQGGAPGSAFADFLVANPQVGAVVAGLLTAPDFRAATGAFDPAKVAGTASPEDAQLDFLLTLPAGASPPYPAVIVQHGFGGSNATVLDVGALLADRGIAAIGISALEHGTRGNPLNLLLSTPTIAREIFRQTVVDQMSLLRAIEQGIDVDGDAAQDLIADDTGYLGISLGGLLGGILAGNEDRLGPAVLNVTGGRAAFLAESPGLRPLVSGTRAELVGLDPDSPELDVFFTRFIEVAGLGQDPADSLNWARRYRDLPFPGARPRRILMQQGVGDALIPNAFTEELAHVAGFATNSPQSDPDGVSGHWIFAPPGGHGIFGRNDVRQQAVDFLVSGGTEIHAP